MPSCGSALARDGSSRPCSASSSRSPPEPPRDWHELTDLFAVHDETDARVYDMHLFCDDDGQVFRAGTTEHVAS